MNTSKYLPIGTVVLLKDANILLMIYGFQVRREKHNSNDDMSDEVFDYVGCIYPTGVIDFESFLLFNHEDIKTIYHFGFRNKIHNELSKLLLEEKFNTNTTNNSTNNSNKNNSNNNNNN